MQENYQPLENKFEQPCFIKKEPLVLVVSQARHQQWEIVSNLEEIGFEG